MSDAAAAVASDKSGGSHSGPAADEAGASEEPGKAASGAKPLSAKSDSADRGLLLLLGTSLLVLLVSVLMLVWGPTTSRA